jgi:hypothetical protein
MTEDLGTTGQRFAALEERIVTLEARLLAPPAVAGATTDASLSESVSAYAERHFGAGVCHVDHDACRAEQRGSAGRAAQGPCVRGVVDLVTPSADDQHAAERGTPAADAEVTASEGGDTARADSAAAGIREAVDMLVKADAHERVAAACDPYDSVRRASLGYEAKRLRRDAEARIEALSEWLLLETSAADHMRARVDEARAERDAAIAKVEAMRRGAQGMEAERDAMRHELASMRAELERERVRRKAAEDALALVAASCGKPSVQAAKRGLVFGAHVRHPGSDERLGMVTGFDEDGDPLVNGVAYYAEDIVLDTEATT